MGKYAHNGGLIEGVFEVGFDIVKYFEDTIIDTAQGFSISPPARRIIIANRSSVGNLYLKVNNGDAEASVSFIPGDNIKIGPGCTFTMDFDTLNNISLISDSLSGVQAEGILGFKGTV